MKRLTLALIALFALSASVSAQVVPPGTNPVPGAGAYNSSPPTCTSGQYCAFQTDVNGQLKVSASVSASVVGFTPGLTFATLTATGSSASVALPAGATVAFQNTGTTTVSCTLGIGSATAVAGEIQVPASSTVFLTVGSNTFGACIDETGSASNVVRLAGGAGLGTGFGGGGGGGGGGGAITAASGSYASGAMSAGSYAAGALVAGAAVDGWDLTQGAKADVAWVSGSGSLIAIAKTIAGNTAAAIPAGTAIIGKVGIDQTTNGTTNGVVNVPVSASGSALTAVTCGSAVSSCVLKASAGNFYGVYAECTAACWLMVFNSTSAPSNGATTAGSASGNLVECVSLTGTAGGSKSINYPTFPVNFSVGITVAISSTACATLTLSTVGFVRGSVL